MPGIPCLDLPPPPSYNAILSAALSGLVKNGENKKLFMSQPLVDILLPVYNEEHVLAASTAKLTAFLEEKNPPFRWRITIGDNASTDGTLACAQGLSEQDPRIHVVHLPRKGRGRMVKHAWKESPADSLTYMDIDLSTDLEDLIPLVDAIVNGADIAIGSRQYPGARVTRGFKREAISRGYILLLKLLLRFPFTDAQCGFKAATKAAVDELFPHIVDNEWFFDTELLHVAHVLGYRVAELPVRWIEDTDSRVKIMRTAWLDVMGVFRMIRDRKSIRSLK